MAGLVIAIAVLYLLFFAHARRVAKVIGELAARIDELEQRSVESDLAEVEIDDPESWE